MALPQIEGIEREADEPKIENARPPLSVSQACSDPSTLLPGVEQKLPGAKIRKNGNANSSGYNLLSKSEVEEPQRTEPHRSQADVANLGTMQSVPGHLMEGSGESNPGGPLGSTHPTEEDRQATGAVGGLDPGQNSGGEEKKELNKKAKRQRRRKHEKNNPVPHAIDEMMQHQNDLGQEAAIDDDNTLGAGGITDAERQEDGMNLSPVSVANSIRSGIGHLTSGGNRVNGHSKRPSEERRQAVEMSGGLEPASSPTTRTKTGAAKKKTKSSKKKAKRQRQRDQQRNASGRSSQTQPPMQNVIRNEVERRPETQDVTAMQASETNLVPRVESHPGIGLSGLPRSLSTASNAGPIVNSLRAQSRRSSAHEVVDSSTERRETSRWNLTRNLQLDTSCLIQAIFTAGTSAKPEEIYLRVANPHPSWFIHPQQREEVDLHPDVDCYVAPADVSVRPVCSTDSKWF